MDDTSIQDIKKFFKGEVRSDSDTLSKFSKDASLFTVSPSVVLSPKDANDIASVVRFAAEKKRGGADGMSITVRAAGSCMSGGSLNDSIILDTTSHMQGVLGFSRQSAEVLPGTFYRDFEKATLEKGLLLPCFTASKNLCAIGGMIGNNSAGEKTLSYGKMEDFVEELNVVFADGKERVVRPLNEKELAEKKGLQDFEGEVYRKLDDLIVGNRSLIDSEKPNVSKNSAGYYLWNVKHDGLFDLCKLLTGAQGTLGIVTKAKIKLVKTKPHSALVVMFMPNIERLGEVVNSFLSFNPETLESYDDSTLKLALRFLPELARGMKASNFLKLGLSFLPELGMALKSGLPKFVLIAEFTGESSTDALDKAKEARDSMTGYGYAMRIAESEVEAEKYWTVRRESFNLLRKHVRGRRTAPFIDDVVVKPDHLPEFLPRLRKILDEARLLYTIAGHAGDGNFHVIPLMDMTDERNKDLIIDISEKVYSLVGGYRGSITAEHNDGIIRTPFLGKMYSPEMLNLFKKTKDIFDPLGIFNPGKKVPSGGKGTFEYIKSHI